MVAAAGDGVDDDFDDADEGAALHDGRHLDVALGLVGAWQSAASRSTSGKIRSTDGGYSRGSKDRTVS